MGVKRRGGNGRGRKGKRVEGREEKRVWEGGHGRVNISRGVNEIISCTEEFYLKNLIMIVLKSIHGRIKKEMSADKRVWYTSLHTTAAKQENNREKAKHLICAWCQAL